MKITHVIILAAGEGKRMHSALPKVLHRLAGVSLLERVVTTALQLKNVADIHVVYGHGGEQVRNQLKQLNVNWVRQEEQLGTGHAVAQALPLIPDSAHVVVLFGDVPLITVATLERLLTETDDNNLGLVTIKHPDPTGLGRILRAQAGDVIGIVEEKDATPEQRQIKEIYSGIMMVSAQRLKRWLPRIQRHNQQQEYYLTDIVKIAVDEGYAVNTITASAIEEVQGVNDRAQLAQLERYYQRQIAQQLLAKGVSLLDPARFDLRGQFKVGRDIIIDVNVICEGNIVLGSNISIGPNCYLKDVQIGDGVTIKANSIIEGAVIAEQCVIGPFARIRPGTHLAIGAHVGNFVEIKNTDIGSGSKINHLSYVGDATLGQDVNIGAGTITCNYDGANKHRTTIHDQAFIGSGTQLIAPITVGANATIGAGSTLTKDAPPDALTISRTKQTTVADWQRPSKNKNKVIN